MKIVEVSCRRPPYAFQFRLLPSIGDIMDKKVKLSEEIHSWCEEQFGKIDAPNKIAGWYATYYDFYFLNSDDAFAFKMRWL